MTVYIAAPFKRRDDARVIRVILQKEGVLSTATWIDTHLSDYDTPPDVLQKEALEDLLDVHRADALVLVDAWPGEGRGMYTEFGFALAKGKPIYILEGKNKNIFYHHPNVRVCATLNELRNALKEAA